jgi:hypothetical protein
MAIAAAEFSFALVDLNALCMIHQNDLYDPDPFEDSKGDHSSLATGCTRSA